MKRTKCQYRRLLRIIDLIRKGRGGDELDNHKLYHNCETIALALKGEEAASTKTISRDLFYLRDDLAAPIKYSRKYKGFYFEDDSFALAGIFAAKEEIDALCMAVLLAEHYGNPDLTAALRQFVEKLSLDHEGNLNKALQSVRGAVGFEGQVPVVESGVLSALKKGITDRKPVVIGFKSYKRDSAKFLPRKFKVRDGHWYVIGMDSYSGLSCTIPLADISKVVAATFDSRSSRDVMEPEDFREIA